MIRSTIPVEPPAYDFAEFRLPDRIGRMGGCLQRTTKCGAIEGVPRWAGFEACPVLPIEELTASPSKRAYQWNTNDQNGYPSCTLTSKANVAEIAMAENGWKRRNVDWYYVWRLLSGGRGGVALDTAVRYLSEKGFPVLDDSGKVVGTIKIVEAWDIPTIQAGFSAVKKGYTLWYGASGHAEGGYSILDDGRSLDVCGTWGSDYGDGGWYPRAWNYIAAGLPYYGAFATRAWELQEIDLPS